MVTTGTAEGTLITNSVVVSAPVLGQAVNARQTITISDGPPPGQTIVYLPLILKEE